MSAPISKPPMDSLGIGWPSLHKTKVWRTHISQDGTQQNKVHLTYRNLFQSPQNQKKDEEQGDHPYSHRAPPTLFLLPTIQKRDFFCSFLVFEDFIACPSKGKAGGLRKGLSAIQKRSLYDNPWCSCTVQDGR